MDELPGPWQEGRKAWDRLEGWQRDASQPPGAADGGERALAELSDSGLVRRLLDQVEFEAVRSARRHGKSWAEIAVRLGVTRQSAWERWRDVDEAGGAQPSAPGALRDPGRMAAGAAAAAAAAAGELVRGVFRHEPDIPPDLSPQAARQRRRRAVVPVPDVIGLSRDGAREVLGASNLVATNADPDLPPLDAPARPDGTVVDQSPEAGALVPPGSAVTLWFGRGGGSGVREPRRPLPDPKTAHQMRDETSGEAVG